MPFNNTTKRFDRIWRFVDQFLASENATRTAFDQTLDDVRVSVNDAITYLEGRDDDIAVSATDLRYIGAFSVTPVTRVGGAPLVLGDFYFDTDDEEFLIYNGTSFVSTTGLTVATRAFLALVDSDDDAAVRTLFGLGTAATQNSTAFATAAQGTKADAAVPAPGGVAVNVTDWQGVHAIGSGPYEGAAGATNAPIAAACAGVYVKRNSTSGVLIVTDTASGRVFRSVFAASAIGAWKELPALAVGGLSAFIETLLNDIDADAARATLSAHPLANQGSGPGKFQTLLSGPSQPLSLPAGGTWVWWYTRESSTSGVVTSVSAGIDAGGTLIAAAAASTNTTGWAWRLN